MKDKDKCKFCGGRLGILSVRYHTAPTSKSLRKRYCINCDKITESLKKLKVKNSKVNPLPEEPEDKERIEAIKFENEIKGLLGEKLFEEIRVRFPNQMVGRKDNDIQ